MRSPVNSRDPTGTRRVENREIRRTRTIANAYRDALVEIIGSVKEAPSVVREGFRGWKEGDGANVIQRYTQAMKDLLQEGVDEHIVRTEKQAVDNTNRIVNNMHVGIKLGDVAIPREEVELLRANLRDQYAVVAGDLAANTNRAVLEGYQKGLGARETARLVEEYTEGMDSQIERIVRTETMRVGDVVSKARYDAQGCDGYYSYPTNDDRVCPHCLCYALNGTYGETDRRSGQLHIFGPNEPMALPLHPNCRCARLPHFDDDKEVMAI